MISIEDKAFTKMNYHQLYILFWELYYNSYFEDLHELMWQLFEGNFSKLTKVEKMYLENKFNSTWKEINNYNRYFNAFFKIPDIQKGTRFYKYYLRNLRYNVPLGKSKCFLYKKIIKNLRHNKFLDNDRKNSFLNEIRSDISIHIYI